MRRYTIKYIIYVIMKYVRKIVICLGFDESNKSNDEIIALCIENNDIDEEK